MIRNKSITLMILFVMIFSLFHVQPAAAIPPAPDDDADAAGDVQVVDPNARPKTPKAIDQPNAYDVWKIREREQQIANGTYVDLGNAVDTDRVLVLLVEFAGTDTFTWTQGTSTWDPKGIADPAELGPGGAGDCSLVVPTSEVPAGESKDFTYGPTLHNTIPQPLSATDRSGDSIWTTDFSKQWFIDFMFGNGVKFDYKRQDGTEVKKDFTGESVRDYYLDMSGGKYDIGGDVVGWVQVPHSTWWYDADQCPGARSGVSTSRGVIPGAGNARTLVRDALDVVEAARVAGDPNKILPADFNWKNYDLDGDGVIDRLWIVHAGYGEEDSPTLLNRTNYGEAAVWSHSSAVTPPAVVNPTAAAADQVKVGAYIVMPENGGISVFAHEYGHNLGAADLYAYGNGETSAGFWTIMADSWTGTPISFEPPAVDPWHLDQWKWLDPYTITDPSKVYEVTLGQASDFPGGAGVHRAVKIELPEGKAPLAAQPIGANYWYSGKSSVLNSMMVTKTPVAVPAGGATFDFDIAYDIEEEWDYLWVIASTDGGTTWTALKNANTNCTPVADWIGGLYGMDGQCGFTGHNASFTDYVTETFTLDAATYGGKNVMLGFWYMTDWGTEGAGAFIDNVVVKDTAATVLFSDDGEAGADKWNYAPDIIPDPEVEEVPFQYSDGLISFDHNYYFQFRNTTATGGYDKSLGEASWRYGPANSGVVAWYNNNLYTDNEVEKYMTDYPGYGPKGLMLVVDANPEPYRSSQMVTSGYNNEGGNYDSRGQMRDATFGLNKGNDFVWTSAWPFKPAGSQDSFTGRPAVSFFDDSLGYYPGAEYISRGPGYAPAAAYRWVTKQWDASVVVPAQGFYGIKAPGYIGTGDTNQQEMRYNCASTAAGGLGCYWYGALTGLGYDGGSGNPGDYGVQYGWHMEVINQTEKTATVRIWNTNYVNQFTTVKTSAQKDELVEYVYNVPASPEDDFEVFACADLDTTKVEYVGGSNILPLAVPCADITTFALTGANLATAVDPTKVVAVAYYDVLDEGESATFMLTVKAKDAMSTLSQALSTYNDGVHHLLFADQRFMQYLPSIGKK